MKTSTKNPELATLASKAKNEHRQFNNLLKSSLLHAKQAGEFLTAAKKIIAATTLDFKKWVSKEVGITPRTANNYLRIAAKWDQVKNNADGTLTAALKTIKGPARKQKQKAGKFVPYLLRASVSVSTKEDSATLEDLILSGQVRWLVKNSNRVLATIKVDSVEEFSNAA